MSENRVQTTIRFPKEFHKRLKLTAAEREVEIQEIVLTAVADYLGKPAAKSAPATAAAAEPSAWHRKLTEILGSGDEATINAVTQNIDVFHDRLRPARRKKTG